MAATTRNKILVTGPSGSSLPLQLVRAVLGASGQSDKADALGSASLQTEGGLVVPWSVTTKYYNAVLDFWVLDGTWDPSETASDGDADGEDGLSAGDWEAVGSAIDAIAVVLDRKQPPGDGFLASWSAFAERFGPAVQVCVGFNHDEGVEDPADVHEWCIENGFEYISVSGPGEEGESTVVDANETSGISRVIEALQAHAWEVSGAPSTSRRTAGTLFDREDIGELLDVDPAEAPFPSNEEIDAMHNSLFGGIDDDDGFDATINKLQRLRDKVQELPDQDRHALAAQVGLAFLKQFEADSSS
ncbi:hypothetical protein DFJ74DRAFT_205978 [Hyaloraphidium curvatum]|nr:hypothetical protein DFJ74DRAFT_205978 [Hyaloraphidium curvatum]